MIKESLVTSEGTNPYFICTVVTPCKQILCSFHRCNSSTRLSEMLCDKLGWHRCLLCLKVNQQNFKKASYCPIELFLQQLSGWRGKSRSAASEGIQRNLSEHHMHHQIIGKLKIEMQGFMHKIAKFDKKLMDGLICIWGDFLSHIKLLKKKKLLENHQECPSKISLSWN